MKLHIILTIEDGPAALTQVVAVQGFANSMGLPMRMQAEDEPKKAHITWGAGEVEALGKRLYNKAAKIMEEGTAMPRKEFVRALAKATGKDPKSIGQSVKKWIAAGVLEEVDGEEA